MNMSDAHILHTLRWAPRLASPTATGKTPSVTTNTNQVRGVIVCDIVHEWLASRLDNLNS